MASLSNARSPRTADSIPSKPLRKERAASASERCGFGSSCPETSARAASFRPTSRRDAPRWFALLEKQGYVVWRMQGASDSKRGRIFLSLFRLELEAKETSSRLAGIRRKSRTSVLETTKGSFKYPVREPAGERLVNRRRAFARGGARARAPSDERTPRRRRLQHRASFGRLWWPTDV